MGIRINHYIGDKDFTQLMVWLVGLGCLVVWIPVGSPKIFIQDWDSDGGNPRLESSQSTKHPKATSQTIS